MAISDSSFGSVHSTFHGPGWQRLQRPDADTTWASTGYRSETAQLLAAMVAVGVRDTQRFKSWAPDELLHTRRIHFGRIADELRLVREALRSYGITVVELRERGVQLPTVRAGANLAFARDLVVASAQGIVIGRPASIVRAGEEVDASAALATAGVPLAGTVLGAGATLEGADCVRLGAGRTIIAVARRTNTAGLQAFVRITGEQVHAVSIQRQAQHLLGVLHPIDNDSVLIRRSLATPQLLERLNALGVACVEVPESARMNRTRSFSMCFVDESTVLLPEGDQGFEAFLRTLGLTPHPLRIPELVAAGGGLSCVVAPLARGDLHAQGPAAPLPSQERPEPSPTPPPREGTH